MKGNKAKKKKKLIYRIWPAVFSVLLIAATTFTLLDAFVFERDVVALSDVTTTTTTSTSSTSTTATSSSSTDDTTSTTASDTSTTDDSSTSSSSDVVVTDTSYEGNGISITITTLREYNTDIYVADIYLDDVSDLMAGLAENSFGRNLKETTSAIAEECGAILAINGDYYGFRDSGYVMRNGYLYRSTATGDSDQEILVLYSDGTMDIMYESSVTAEELVEAGAVDIWSFGPGLVEDGEIAVSQNEEVDQAKTSNPRTAIGMVEPGHYIMVVADGRTSASAGLTLYELATIMQDLGCTEAYNFDGGGSSTMYFMGEVINNPTSNGKTITERAVSDIVYIAG
ncbi:MAG: phosphodiester glycosidase family protein [Oscillospiraceae bacterium]|jgi:exopolysaccharide biosynthesis protein